MSTKMGRLTSLMAMGVSLTSHSNPLVRHIIPSTSSVSRSSPRHRTLRRKEGYVGYSTTPFPPPEVSCIELADDASSCGTPPKIDNGYKPRDSRTTRVPVPLSMEFDSSRENRVSLIGFVDRPVKAMKTGSDRIGVYTLLRVEDPDNPLRCFRIFVKMWYDLARKCTAQLKPGDLIHVSGRLVCYSESTNWQVELREVSELTEIPNQPKIKTSFEYIGYVNKPLVFDTSVDGEVSARTVIARAPPHASESKLKSPKNYGVQVSVIFQGDLAHTACTYLNKGDRVYISGHLNLASPSQEVLVSEFRNILGSKAPRPTSVHEEGERNSGADPWYDLLDNPMEWYDYRENKQNGSVLPLHPDFVKKDGSESLWLQKVPKEILQKLEGVTFCIPVILEQKKGKENNSMN